MAPQLLDTDGYKFSMAEAGWPLAKETFYYSHRKGGPHFLPFDVKEMVRGLLPTGNKPEDYAYLKSQGYAMGGGFQEAMLATEQLEIKSLPKNSWFFDREPVFTVTGPSAIVSWLEPLVLQLHYRIQVATIAKIHPEDLADIVGSVTSEEQKRIVQETLASIGVECPEINVRYAEYQDSVVQTVTNLIAAVGDATRIFEVGMRAATGLEQHNLALQAAQHAGLLATSNVALAQDLGLKAVGTMGHEHIQRYGSDATAFRAMRNRFPGSSSFLLDTFDTIHSGLPEAFALIQEDPSRKDSVRFDSGDKATQYLIACMKAKGMGITPRFILEDGFTLGMVKEFEALRAFTKVAPENQAYGFGGYIVNAPWEVLTRDRVAAVWKLTQSDNTPTMKFGDEPGAGKESIPGKPVLFRPYLGRANSSDLSTGVVLQEGEEIPHKEGAILSDWENLPFGLRMTASEVVHWATRQTRPTYSPATQEIVNRLYSVRNAQIGRK